MSKYTIELRKVLEREPLLFTFPYDFYDDSKRLEFEDKFIRHFFFREICTDSIEHFKHLLRDKFDTTLPYYNKLFEAAQIEYSILDNYKMVEKTTISRENEGKTAGFASAVGKVNDSENSTARGTGSDTSESSGNSTLKKTGTVTENATNTETGNSATNRKMLDTPNGRVNFDDPSYVSNIGKDDTTTSKSGMTDRTVTNNTTDTTANENTVNATTESETETNRTAEQKTTTDANNREYMQGSMKETTEHTRTGNIGVDTDSDMIHKHIGLQKILAQIERMFFDECEDLFLQVW